MTTRLTGITATPLRRFSLRAVFLLALFALLPPALSAQIEITLKDSFIEKYKNRATIDAGFLIDKAHARPNPPSKDGDLHIAGRAAEVGLPMVAEIMNAASQPEAVDLVHEREGSGEKTAFIGAWRIWCEHGGESQQVQGKPLEPFDTTNPAHVFQIHPLTHIADKDLAATFHPIDGFQTKDAERAFLAYENIRSRIRVNAARKTTTITTGMAGYNYVEFLLEISSDPLVVDDGRFFFASVETLDGDLLARNRRMVFVKDTPPEVAVRNAHRGTRLHVLGVPRVDLALLSWRTHNAQSHPEVLSWNLPYEMVIVGLYETLPDESN